jgi:argininosuccinate synthase
MATGKRNLTKWFELTFAGALNPDIKVIAPWREWGSLAARTGSSPKNDQIPS